MGDIFFQATTKSWDFPCLFLPPQQKNARIPDVGCQVWILHGSVSTWLPECLPSPLFCFLLQRSNPGPLHIISMHSTIELYPQRLDLGSSCLCLPNADIVGLYHLAKDLYFLINTKASDEFAITKSVTSLLPSHTVAETLHILITQLRVPCLLLVTSSCNSLTSWLTIVLPLYLLKPLSSQFSPVSLDIDRCYWEG